MGGYSSIEDLKSDENIRNLIKESINSIYDMQNEYHESVKEVTKIDVNSDVIGSNEVNSGGGVMIGSGKDDINISQSTNLQTEMQTMYYGNFLSKNDEPIVQLVSSDLLNITQKDNAEKEMPNFYDPVYIMTSLGFNVKFAEFDFENNRIKYIIDYGEAKDQIDEQNIQEYERMNNEQKVRKKMNEESGEEKYAYYETEPITRDLINKIDEDIAQKNRLMNEHDEIDPNFKTLKNKSSDLFNAYIFSTQDADYDMVQIQNNKAYQNNIQKLSEELNDGKYDESTMLEKIVNYEDENNKKDDVKKLKELFDKYNNDKRLANDYKKEYDEVQNELKKMDKYDKYVETLYAWQNLRAAKIKFENVLDAYENSITTDYQFMTFEKLYNMLTSGYVANINEKILNIKEKVKNIETNITRSTYNYAQNKISINGNLEDTNLSQDNVAIQKMYDGFEKIIIEADKLVENEKNSSQLNNDNEFTNNANVNNKGFFKKNIILILIILIAVCLLFLAVVIYYKRKVNIASTVYTMDSAF